MKWKNRYKQDVEVAGCVIDSILESLETLLSCGVYFRRSSREGQNILALNSFRNSPPAASFSSRWRA